MTRPKPARTAGTVAEAAEHLQRLIRYSRTPMEVCYDEFAYKRIVAFYRSEMQKVLAKMYRQPAPKRRGRSDVGRVSSKRRLAWHHYKNKGPLLSHLNECVPTRPDPMCPCGLAKRRDRP